MGKRELFIVIAFVAVGALAYQLTAPAPKAGEEGFSFSKMFSGLRNEIRSHASSATITKNGTVEVRKGVSEIRVTSVRAMPVTVTGEDRTDIGYELSVTSDGPDEATARQWAEKAKIVDDDLGSAQALSVWFPPEGEQTAKLLLKVPRELLIRLEGSGRTMVSDVRAVELRNMTAELSLNNIGGPVTGSYRASDLTITGALSVTLALASSRAKLSGIKGPISINARSGNCSIAESKGPVEVTVSQVELAITDQDGDVKVTGDNGAVRLVRPTGEISVDVRRADVDVTLDKATPAAIVTTEERLRLTLVGPPSVSIDALVNGSGIVRAPALGLDPATRKESKFAAPVGAGGPRIVLRNSREDIEIIVRK